MQKRREKLRNERRREKWSIRKRNRNEKKWGSDIEQNKEKEKLREIVKVRNRFWEREIERDSKSEREIEKQRLSEIENDILRNRNWERERLSMSGRKIWTCGKVSGIRGIFGITFFK